MHTWRWHSLPSRESGCLAQCSVSLVLQCTRFHLVRLEKQRDQVKDAEVSLYGVMRGYFHHLHSIHRERTHGLVALFRYLDDLQEAIAILEELVSTISLSDNRYCAGLPENFTTEFNNWGELRDLEDATNAQGAVVLTPNHHPHGLRGRSSAVRSTAFLCFDIASRGSLSSPRHIIRTAQ
ncbi:hypothetical protein L210DRAFT_2697941 [Boletus edulis BED1]|uniref:Uncharacterized protein n=1 Tax=Boletus edulis BED1 TaxID=1328754 RepID=A0AAD4BL81_BOLED|nr:hypothetical protein L210DRAFT_2697941 [Boletus edulis BED1]